MPLDYFDDTLGNASLAVARYLARDRENVKGMVFVNPGGECATKLQELSSNPRIERALILVLHALKGLVEVELGTSRALDQLCRNCSTESMM